MAEINPAERVPEGLGQGAQRFWHEITEEYTLGPHELRVLHDICKAMEVVDILAERLDMVDVLTVGSQGQPVVHPLVAELRQSRAALSQLMSKLNLPDADDEGGEPKGEANPARAMANKRWNNK